METRRMVIETRNMVVETKKVAEAAEKRAADSAQIAQQAKRQADAAWELVVITRNQVQEELRYMKLPWWKKVRGKAA